MKWNIEIEIDIHIDYQPEEKETRTYPGCPAGIEIGEVLHAGEPVPDSIRDVVLKDYDAIFEQYVEDIAEF